MNINKYALIGIIFSELSVQAGLISLFSNEIDAWREKKKYNTDSSELIVVELINGQLSAEHDKMAADYKEKLLTILYNDHNNDLPPISA